MTVITSGALTLMDHGRRVDPDGKIAKIIEQMNNTNEVLDDMLWLEGNQPTGHVSTLRTGLPTIAWRQINQGVQPSKSTTKQQSFTCGMLEGFGQVDEALVDLAMDKANFRLSENAPYIEAMSQTLASTTFYGDVNIYPDRFTGLTPYYSDPSAASGANLINGGGSSTDNTSLWLVYWGEQTCHGIFPKGSKAGIDHKDLGLQLVEDGVTTGSKFMAYVDQYKTRAGLALRDWRYAVRICNLDVSDLATAGASSDSAALLMRLMIQAINKIPKNAMGRPAWYCNKEVKTALDIQAFNKANAQITIKEVEGRGPITMFMGIPVRRVDALLNTESKITFS